jgi:ferredoxin--NADP+ reductase
MEKIGQSFAAVRESFFAELDKWALPIPSKTRVLFRFLSSPTRVLEGPDGRCGGLEVEETELAGDAKDPKAKGTGRKVNLDVTGVIFAVGDTADPGLGLPYKNGKFLTQPPAPGAPPGDAAAYHVYDEAKAETIPGVFVAGWSRNASEGVVGKAKVDGEKCAAVVLGHLASKPARPAAERTAVKERLISRLREKGVDFVTWEDLQALEAWEREKATAGGLSDPAEAKLKRDADMLAAIAEKRKAAAGAAK